MEATHLTSVLASAVILSATSDSHNIADFKYGSVQVTGGITDSIQVEISNDGSTWVDQGAAITANGITELNLYSRYIRVEITRVDGTITVTLVAKR